MRLTRRDRWEAAVPDESVPQVLVEAKMDEGPDEISGLWLADADRVIVGAGHRIRGAGGIGLGMTVVVYGLVGCIIKLDDVGMWFMKKKSKAAQKFGQGILFMMPYLMKTLSVVGTIAMFSVGGGIIIHGVPALSHALHDYTGLLGILIATVLGLVAGMITVPLAHKLGAPCAAIAGKVKDKVKTLLDIDRVVAADLLKTVRERTWAHGCSS
jgi:hypothetical protein